METQTPYTTAQIETLPKVVFSSNYNSKLDCAGWSTIRLRNDKKWHLNNDYAIILKEIPIYVAKLVSIKHFLLELLTPAMSYLDCGYSPKETQELIRTMYKKYNIDWSKQDLSFLVFYHNNKLPD